MIRLEGIRSLGIGRSVTLKRLVVPLSHVALLAVLSFAFLMALYQIRSSPVTVNPGETSDHAGLVGFYGQERNSDFSYRWSQASSYVSLPSMSPQPYLITLKLFGGPASVPERAVTVWANNVKLGEVKAGHRLETFSFEYSPTLNDARLLNLENLVIAINTEPFQEPGKLRQLGVMVSSVEVTPIIQGLALPPAAQIPLLIGLALSLYGLIAGLGAGRKLALAGGLAGLAGSLLVALYQPDWVMRAIFFMANTPQYIAIVVFLVAVLLIYSWLPESAFAGRILPAAHLLASLAAAAAWYWLIQRWTSQNASSAGELYREVALWLPVVAGLFSAAYAAALLLGLTVRAKRAVVLDLLTYFSLGMILLLPAWQPDKVLGWTGTPGPFLQLAGVAIGIIALRAFLLLKYLMDNCLKGNVSEAKLRAVVLIGSLAVFLSLAGWESATRTYQADEPHYLMSTLSLIQDHDIDLTNNYANGDYRSYYPATLVSTGGFHIVEGPDGAIYPRHELGLSFAVIPGLFFGGKLGVELELALLASGLLVSLFSLCRDVGCSVRASLGAWLLIAFTSPFLVYSLQVFPEIVGAILLTVSLRSLCVRPKNKWYQLLLGGVALGLAPWFHARFWLLVGGVAPFVLRQILTKWKSLLAFGVCLLVVVGLFAVVGKAMYNVALPNASVFAAGAFRGFFVSPVEMAPRILGLLFDRTQGLFPTGPIYLLTPIGILLLARRTKRFAFTLAAVFMIYFLVNSAKGLWFAGWVPPARYLVCLTPIFAVGLAMVLDEAKGKALKVGIIALAVWSYGVALILTMVPDLRYFDPVAYTSTLDRALSELIHLDPGVVFPNFLTGPISAQTYIFGAGWLAAILLAAVAVYLLHPGLRPAPTEA